MRIGLIAPPWVPVPPTAYGGTEAVVDNLARGLARLGHDVTLFTVGGSTSPVRRMQEFDAPAEPIGMSVPEAAHVLAAYKALDGVDIVHDHTVLGPLIAGRSGFSRVPVVVTNHGPYTPVTRPLFAEMARTASLVAISHDQAARSGLPIAAVIHHGIDLEVYRPAATHGSYLVFVGRMSPDKGVHRAVRIAHAAGRAVRLVTKMRERAEIDYFESMVRPLLRDDSEMPSELGLHERIEVVAHAAALINPIQWPEPFGLVMAEALAAGTPVITTPRGAAPEIVSQGRTGFFFHDDGEAVAAVGELGLIDRAECRRAAETRFSLERMTADHVALYERILDRSTRRTRRAAVVSLARPHSREVVSVGRARVAAAAHTDGVRPEAVVPETVD